MPYLGVALLGTAQRGNHLSTLTAIVWTLFIAWALGWYSRRVSAARVDQAELQQLLAIQGAEQVMDDILAEAEKHGWTLDMVRAIVQYRIDIGQQAIRGVQHPQQGQGCHATR